MQHFLKQSNETVRTILLVTVLVLVCCSGAWSVSYYLNQDGTAHLYNAYLIVEILKGNEQILQFARINPSLTIPNLTGHWLLVPLLQLFGPPIATKLMVTLTFGLFVAAVVWLRIQVTGSDRKGIILTALFACAIAFNWIWFLGFYNFTIAAAGFAFCLGLWWRWRDKMTSLKALCLAIAIGITFLSHLVSFGLLVGSIVFLLILNLRRIPRRSAVWSFASVAAVAPLVVNYILVSREAAGSFSPRWIFVSDVFSVRQWLAQLLAGDPFSLISRKAFPFIESTSPVFAVFTPVLWLAIAIAVVAIATGVSRSAGSRFEHKDDDRNRGWLMLAGLFVVFWLVGPDDLGKAHGGYLRERTLILGLVCLVPWINFKDLSRRYAYAVAACLAFIILFQTAVIWDYADRSKSLVNPFLAASEHITDSESFGSFILIDEAPRFRSRPLANLTPVIGIGKNGPVWDNYEFGYHLFPVTAVSPEVRRFVYDFREANTVDLRDPLVNVAEKQRALAEVMEREHARFAVLLVWNEQPGFVDLRKRWFEDTAFFQSGELQLFKHR